MNVKCRVGTLLELQEIPQDLSSIIGQDALGMELDTPNGELFVADPHDFALLGLGGYFQASGHALLLNHQRMITSGSEGIGHADEEVPAIVFYEGGFTVHHAVVHDDVAAEDMPNTLVTQAHAQSRDGSAKGANHVIG